MKHIHSILIGAGALLAASAGVGGAHVTINSGPAVSNVSGVVTFQIAHGCSKVNSANDTAMKDTKSLTINIPNDGAGTNVVKGVRALTSASFAGVPAVVTNNGKVTSVTWTKPDSDLQASDVGFYTVQLRFAPATDPASGTSTPTPTFSQIQFTATQVCKDPNTGATSTVFWDGLKHADPWQTAVSCNADTDCTAGTTCDTTAHTCMEAAEPAPTLNVVDARLPGWNHYAINSHIPDPSVYFSDAQIVWMLTSQEGCTSPPCAYSANPAIMTAIGMTPGITPATMGIHPGGDIWVKY